MKAVHCERFGDPAEVLQLRDVPPPAAPQSGEVRVRMLASPINPSDMLMIQGAYGRQPRLPCVPGFEGVGIVEAGSGLLAKRRAEQPRGRPEQRHGQLAGAGHYSRPASGAVAGRPER